MANLSLQLNASSQRCLQAESVAVVRLGERGRLALVQVDDWQAGRTLVNLYDWDYDPTQEFDLRLSLQGLSQWGTLSDALGAFYQQPSPGGRRPRASAPSSGLAAPR